MTAITPVTASTFTSVQPATSAATGAVGTNFGDAITGALQSVSAAENQADQLAVAIASGEDRSVSDLMIATSKATLSVELMAQVRNRAIEAYQEIMRMQV